MAQSTQPSYICLCLSSYICLCLSSYICLRLSSYICLRLSSYICLYGTVNERCLSDWVIIANDDSGRGH